MKLTYSLDHAYRTVLGDVLAYGDVSSPRGMRTRELLHASFTTVESERCILSSPARRLSYPFSVAEFMWIALGRRDAASISYFNRNIAQFSDDGVHFYGAYGPWVAAQLPYVVRAIKEDRDTRQAVLTIWRQSPPKTRDVPCTVAMQFLLRKENLHAQTFMRSNDAWLGLPYDAFNFMRLQAMVAGALGVRPGRYTHTVGSLHLYERDWEGAERVLAEPTDLSPAHAAAAPPIAPPARPEELSYLFTQMADPATAPGLDVSGVEAPWRQYLEVLRYKTTRDRSRLPWPYDALIPVKREG